jgi:hypothetical protein
VTDSFRLDPAKVIQPLNGRGSMLVRIPYAASVGIVVMLLVPPALGADSAEIARIDAAMWSYVVFAASVTLVKIVSLVIGYLVARLGYTTMMAGVQGKDSVELKFADIRFAFKGVTPGLALGAVGVLMMIWALSTKHHFTTEASSTSSQVSHQEGAMQPQKKEKPAAGKAPGKKSGDEKAEKF